MEVIKDIEEATKKLGKMALALGNFDGVHLGHQRLIRSMVSYSRSHHLPAVVFTFHPHPSQVLFPEKAPRLLITPERRSEKIANLGVDALLMIPFTRDIARLSPEFFIYDILHRRLKTQAVFVGFNYTFGHRGAGTPELLRIKGEELGIRVEVLPPVKVGNVTVSSTEIRKALEEGDIIRARNYLGYWPIIEGKVVLGDQRGRQIGFPTANLERNEEVLLPARGVYVAKVNVGGRLYDGVVNIGVKPTFGGEAAPIVEVHILEFTQVIYGQWITLFLLKKLRDECKFSSVKELTEQIRKDIEAAKAHRYHSLFF